MALGPEDHLRLVSLHCLAHGAWRPLWLCDVAAAVEARPAGFDWDYLLSGSRHARQAVLCALRLAVELLGADPALSLVSERRAPGWLVRATLAAWGNPPLAHGTRAPFRSYLVDTRGLGSALAARWPSAVEATMGVRAPFNAIPRLPFQLAECARRVTGFLRRSSRTTS